MARTSRLFDDRGRPVWLVATLVAIIAAASGGCTLSKESAPTVSAPSEFATSIVLSASPEVLQQDGASVALVTAFVRDASSAPMKDVAIHWDATASSTRALPVTLSANTTVTDASGRASVVVTAPPVPTETPTTPDTITVTATPVSGSLTQQEPRRVVITLKAPTGVLPANNAPVATFVATPSAGIIGESVTFDARSTRDEGEPCLARCTYVWDFGDGVSATGMVVAHTFTTAASSGFTVTLTVVDDRNGIGTSQQSFVVSDTSSAVPVARFTVVPGSPQAGTEAMFDASGSAAANGAVISSYAWNWGDGSSETTGSATKGHTYTEARTYTVTLTVTDTQGRVSTTTAQSVTVR